MLSALSDLFKTASVLGIAAIGGQSVAHRRMDISSVSIALKRCRIVVGGERAERVTICMASRTRASLSCSAAAAAVWHAPLRDGPAVD